MNVTRSHSPPGGVRRRTRGERAASLVEYVMMIALIAFVCITALSYFGSSNSGSVTSSANSIATAG
jgi:Flp pilus assembly pilin Flp